MATNENSTYQLPAGWRKWSDDKLGELSADLYILGEYDAMEQVDGELELREDEASMWGPAYNTPSLEDRGIDLGSYAS